MLSRKQLRTIQTLRGVKFSEIVQRTGIPNQALMTLINGQDKDGKDPSKLISQVTYERVLDLLGVDSYLSGLRKNGVLEWRFVGTTKSETNVWKDAFTSTLTDRDLLSGDIEVCELTTKQTFLDSTESMILMHDVESDVRIIITGVDKSARSFIQKALSKKITRNEISKADFELTRGLVRNGVYRITQFNITMGGKQSRYNWADVQAAAKEFDFHTDDLIEMMIEKVQIIEEEKMENQKQDENKVLSIQQRVG